MAPPKAFDFTGDVAIVSGAGSRMPGEFANSVGKYNFADETSR